MLHLMSATRHLHNLALIGFMGTGKSSVGHLLAAQLHYTFVDTDELIAQRAGKSINDIFAQNGETTFRDYESAVVADLAHLSKTVISTGGGLGANDANLESLKQHALVVCLWARPETIWQRVGHQTHRPLLHGEDPLAKIRSLLEQREPYYRKADVLISTEMRSIREVSLQILHQYQSAQGRPVHG
ncbi:MAG: shikimate kinase [Verrucomicrobiota bacterium]